MFRIALALMVVATALAGCAQTSDDASLPTDAKAAGIPTQAGYLGVQGIWLGSDVDGAFDADALSGGLSFSSWPETRAFATSWDWLAAGLVDSEETWAAGWIATQDEVMGDMECIHLQQDGRSDGRRCSNIAPRMAACGTGHHPPRWDPRDAIAPPAPNEVLFLTYDRGHAALIDCDAGTWHWTVQRVAGSMDMDGWRPVAATTTFYDEDGDVLTASAPTDWWGPGHDVVRMNEMISFEPTFMDGDVMMRGELVQVPDRPASLHVRLERDTPVQVADAWHIVGPGGQRVPMAADPARPALLEALVPDAEPGTWHVDVGPEEPVQEARVVLVDLMT